MWQIYQVGLQVGLVVGDVHGCTTEHVGGPNEAGKSNVAAELPGRLVILKIKLYISQAMHLAAV